MREFPRDQYHVIPGLVPTEEGPAVIAGNELVFLKIAKGRAEQMSSAAECVLMALKALRRLSPLDAGPGFKARFGIRAEGWRLREYYVGMDTADLRSFARLADAQVRCSITYATGRRALLWCRGQLKADRWTVIGLGTKQEPVDHWALVVGEVVGDGIDCPPLLLVDPTCELRSYSCWNATFVVRQGVGVLQRGGIRSRARVMGGLSLTQPWTVAAAERRVAEIGAMYG